MSYIDFENHFLSILSLILLLLSFLLGFLFLFSPFLFVKFILKKKLKWWVIILCLIASYFIFQLEIWAWWRFWEWGFEKIGEAI